MKPTDRIKPYQLRHVAKGTRALVEVMSYPTPEGQVYVRLVPGDATSACWVDADELGPVAASTGAPKPRLDVEGLPPWRCRFAENGNVVYVADTADGLVEALAKHSPFALLEREVKAGSWSWVESVANRVSIWTGTRPFTDSSANFLRSLAQLGILELQEGGDGE